jgi:predicted transcriptional regulator
MKKIDLKIEMLKRGIKQTDIARQLGITSQAVCNYLNDEKRASKRLEKYFRSLLSKKAA